ncbi:MAG: M48 family metalloprotease [Bacteroidota bacterium]
MTHRKSNLFALPVVLLISCIIQACAVNPVTGKKQVVFISESQEIAMGKQYDPSIIAEFGMYEDEDLQSFITAKGKEMGAISHRPELDYQFRILDSPVVNAFAVPGGYIYFTRGIMAHFNNEAEFAGVLGHEIGHVTARHSVVQMSKQQLYSGLFVAGMIVSEEFRQFGELGSQALGALFLKFGRDDESQSDELGVDYSTQIGYDSHEMANFFKVLDRKRELAGQQRIPEFQSTHPDPVNRFNRVHHLSKIYQEKSAFSSLKVNRDSYLRLIDGLIYGEDPRQGYVEYNTFFHPELKFHFPVPPDWRIINSPQSVQMASQDGKALMIMTLAQGSDINTAVQATIENDGLQIVEQRNITVNGLQAHAMISVIKPQQTQNGQPAQDPDLRILTYHILYNNLIYKFHGLSKTADFNTYYRSFANTMGNFDRLTDQRKIDVSPDRIKVVQVPRTALLSSILQSYANSQEDMEEIAVLNNMELTDQIASGTLIKTIAYGRSGSGRR